MRRTLLSLSLILLIGVPGAFAQGGGGTSTATKNPSAGSSSGVLPAPVGHRQPRPADIPDEKYQQNNPNDLLSKENAALDKKIKSICRGC